MEQRADYITKNAPAPKPWRCRGCGRVLGQVGDGRLYVNLGDTLPVFVITGEAELWCPCGHVMTWEYRRLKPSAYSEEPLFVERMREQRAAMDAAFDMLEEDLRETGKA